MKKIAIALIILMTVIALGVGATFVFAAPATVYVSSAGNDAKDGTSAANAVKTLDRAFALMPDGGKIVFTGTSYTIDKDYTTPKSEGKYTLTSEMVDSKGNAGVVNYSGALSLNADFLIENIRFKGSSTPIIVCNGNNVTFGNNIKNDADSYIVGGANLLPGDDGEKGNLTEDYTIEIKSGRWQYFYGGNRRSTGSSPTSTISANINIIIDGATFKNTDLARDGKTNCISGMNSVNGNINFTMKSGEIYGCLYAVGRLGTGGKSPSYNGDITVRLLGGTCENLINTKGNGLFEVFQDSNGKLNGNFHLEISDTANVKFTSIGSAGVTGAATLDVPAALVAKCTGFVRDVYVSGNGKDTNGGTSVNDAYATLAKAAEAVKDNGGKIIVCGNIDLSGDVVLKEASKEVVITSAYKNENYKNSAKLTVGGTLAISSNVTFENITLAGNGIIFANGKTLTLSESVASDGALNISASAPSGDSSIGGQVILLGGSYNVVSAGSINGKGAASASGTLVSVEGASVKVLTVSGGNDVTGSAVASILKGEVTEGIYGIYGTGEAKLSGGAIVEVSGGKVSGKIAAISDGITGTAAGKYEFSLLGGDISAVEKITGSGFTTSVGKAADELLSKLEGFGSTVKETVIFVKLEGAGTKDGSSPENAIDTIENAIKLLGDDNGTIVVCGASGVGEFTEPAHKGEIKITSRYAGVDYRRVADAKFILSNKYILSGPVTFDDIVISTDGKTRLFFGNGHPLTFGEGVSCVIDNPDSGTYPYIFGGINDKAGTVNGTTLTVNGGTWDNIIGGNRNSGTYLLGDINLTINGGNVNGFVAGTGYGTISGNVKVEINGGTVKHGVFGIYCDTTNNTTVEGNIDIHLNGGIVKGKVNASRLDPYCSFNGVYTVHINGSNLDSVTDIRGAAELRGTSESKRTYGEGINYTDAPTGSVEAQNPLCSGADPWVIYHDGFYYMALVRGSSVCISKAATVADLGDAEPVAVWTANEESGLASIWSPELHYFSKGDFGVEHEGWYLYIACIPYGVDEDDQINVRRCYVLKAVTSDPQGSYMAPDTKKLNQATKMKLYEDDTLWCIGPSIFRIEGKIYLTWTGTQKETGKTRQNLNIAEMTSPYEIKIDTAAVFCWPTETWEKYGASYDASNPKNLPEVVEGATALYGPNGSVYCVYSVSGYWTDHYALASLKFKGGNPCDINNWEKSAAPIFVANRTDVFGPGHAAFVQSADGLTNYFIYHGYKASGRVGGRYVHVEEYTFDEDGNLHLGSGVAATKDQPVTVAKNPMPLSAKMSAFSKASTKPSSGESTDTTVDTTPDTTLTPDVIEPNNTLVIVIIVAVAVVAVGTIVGIILSKKKKSPATEDKKEDK